MKLCLKLQRISDRLTISQIEAFFYKMTENAAIEILYHKILSPLKEIELTDAAQSFAELR